MNESVVKSLEEIIKEGYNWHDGLCTIIVDLCKRVKELEDEKTKGNKIKTMNE